MAKKRLSFLLVGLFSLNICSSYPHNFLNRSLAEVVLDGRKDCRIIDTNPNVIKFFKAHHCPHFLNSFSDDFFNQRDVLPCIGTYDALYRLCEFPVDKIMLEVSNELKNSTLFCTEANRIFKDLNFTYKGDLIKKWYDALVRTMLDDVHCKNLCILGNNVNEQCVTMVASIKEYLRLNETLPPSKPEFIEAVSVIKPSSISAPNSPPSVAVPSVNADKIIKGNDRNSSLNVTNIKEKDGLNIATAPKPKENGKEIVKDTQDIKTDSKLTKLLSKPKEKVPDSIVMEKSADGLPHSVPENPIKSFPPSQKPLVDSNINIPAIPVVADSHIQKIAPNDGVIDLEDTNEDIITPQVDDIHGSVPMENEEGIPPDTEGKPEDTEIEKPVEVEKASEKEREQNIIFPRPLRDNLVDSEDSYSFPYIVTTMAALCMVYLLFHYRNKLLALALEGRKGKNYRGRGRPSSANYSKLHSNLEEAIASNVSAPTATHVLY